MAQWRFYAQRLLTNVWLDRDLQLKDVTIEWSLTAPGHITATADAITAREIALDGWMLLDEWSTAIYAELDGFLRWGGILTHSAAKENGERELEILGFSTYPKGRVFEGVTMTPPGHQKYIEADPFDIVRTLWAEAQADPTGNIGVTVDTAKSGVVIGRAIDPYELAWWNTPDIGGEIDNLMSMISADYRERVDWADADRTVVTKRIELAYPQLGRRRLDLRFVEGENVIVEIAVTRDGDQYANYIFALGMGEDRSTLRQVAGQLDTPRVRRDKVVTSKLISHLDQLRVLADVEHLRSRNLVYLETIDVVDHPNAPIGSLELGDEILVQTEVGFQKLARWVRVVGMQIVVDDLDKMTLTIEYSRVIDGLGHVVDGVFVAGEVPSNLPDVPGDPGDYSLPDVGDVPDGPPAPPEPPPGPSAVDDTLRVATYNVAPVPSDKELASLNKIEPDADIICLQEASHHSEILKKFLKGHDKWKLYWGEGSNDTHEKREIAILYRKSIGTVKAAKTELTVHGRYLGPDGTMTTAPNKYVTRLEIDQASTLRRLVFLNLHMIPSVQDPAVHGAEKDRRKAFYQDEVAALDTIIDAHEGLLFVTGDFNATPDYAPLNPFFTRVTLDHNFNTLGSRRVDYVCHRAHAAISVQSTKQVSDLSSDHDCVIVTYKIKGT